MFNKQGAVIPIVCKLLKWLQLYLRIPKFLLLFMRELSIRVEGATAVYVYGIVYKVAASYSICVSG